MNIYVVWIDREHAKLFHFSQDKMERTHLESRVPNHHTHEIDHLDQARQDRAFHAEIAARLSLAQKLLILGPGVAKYHFQNYLVEHAPLLGKKIVGCETVDHPTDPQIAAFAKKFFGMQQSKYLA